MDKEESDIGRVWEDALDKYYKDTGTNIKHLPQMQWNVSAIRDEQERQVEAFNRYRHNQGLVDKFRTAISRNSKVILSVTKLVTNAASSAFPPSAAILTAFTYVMKASKNVSYDYDQVEAFFDIMGSLLERLSLLESKLPSAKSYKAILMQVFSSLMELCGTATKYITDGRFKHALKALYKGQDDDIKADYTKLETNIQRLESATMFATLATVIETKTDVKDLTAISMQSLKVSNQSLTVSIETNSMARDLLVMQGASLRILQRFEKREDDKKESEKEGSKTIAKDSGAKKNAALNLVKNAFATPAEPAVQLKEVQTSFVTGTFTWIFEEDSYKTFMDGGSPYLWIYGPPGVGKSCLAYSIIVRFLESTGSEARSSVVYFFFKEEHEELRSANNMLKAAIIQTAIRDSKYRAEVRTDLTLNGSDFNDDLDQIWNRFFAERYPKGSDQKLFIVLDGIDEADEKEVDKLLELFKQVKKDDLSIQIIFTSRPLNAIPDKLDSLELSKIEIKWEKVSERGGDLWKIIKSRCRTLPKLKRLQKPVLRKVGIKLRLKADSVLYADHMLRRLNALGRESLILKELDILPDGLPKLYELLLSECQNHRSMEQFTALKKLFAWLAYSKRPLTLGEATSLIKIIPGTKSFSLEEEIDGRSARILGLATDVADDGSSIDESEGELSDKQNEEETPSYLDNSITSPLKFQERTMRQYFRAMEVDESGLRSSPSQGHLTIFEMAVRILNSHVDELENENETRMIWALRDYSIAFWMQHFVNIDPENTPEHEVPTVINSLHTIMDPEGEALKNIELYTRDSESCNFFGAPPYPLREKFLASLKIWVERGSKFAAGTFSTAVVYWMKLCTSEADIMVNLAKAHIMNLFAADRSYKARRSFEFARTALQLTSLAPDLSKGVLEDENVEADILAVVNILPDIEKTSQVVKAIGSVFYAFDLYGAALEQMKKSLEMTTSNSERYVILCFIGQIELDLSEKLDGEEQNEHVRKAYDSINEGLALYRERKEVKIFAERKDWKTVLQGDITNRARCEIKLGQIDKAVETIDEAYKVINDFLDDRFVNDITAELDNRKDFEKLIAVVEKLKKLDLLYWLGFVSAGGNDRFQRAAWECKRKHFLIKIYNTLIPEVDKYNLGAHVRNQLATAYQFVFPNYEEAKRLLFEILDGKKQVVYDDADEDFLFTVRLQIADLLTEQFRATSEPNEKLGFYREMKSLVLQHSLAMANDFNPYESQTMISLALMTGKLGPTSEFQDLMEKTFRGCLVVLQDTQPWNDSFGFRLLAKVLAFIPELKRDAQIAYSLQFSSVDVSLLNPQEIAEEKVDIPDGDTEALEIGGTVEESPTAEDISPYSKIFCNSCSKVFADWNEGPVYLCILCTNVDLCEDCWQKRANCNIGEEWRDWKSFCREGHRYIKGPVIGWKGVKGGVMKLDGGREEKVGENDEGGSGDTSGEGEEIVFREWLEGLQEKWTEAWKRFWKKEELVVDIL